MSSYKTVQAAVLTIIRLLDSYDNTNSSEGDYRIIDAGNDLSVVLTPGESPHLRADQQAAMRVWEVMVDFFVRVAGDEPKAWATFIDKRDELLTHVEAYPTLNSTPNVHQVRISAQGAPLGVPTVSEALPADGALDMIWQEISIPVMVDYNVSGGEYA